MPEFQPAPAGPAWPGWLGVAAGFALIGAGTAGLDASPGATLEAALLAIGGSLALLGGLVYLALRALRARRHLPADRYRGPSVLLLLFIVLALGNVVAIPLAAILLGGGLDLGDPVAISVLLVLTPASFLAVALLFVVLPRALPGLRLTDGGSTVGNLLRGLGWSVPAWLVGGLVGLAVSFAYQRLTGSPAPEGQAVIELLAETPPVVAFVTIAVLAPLAEELFFRGTAFNAWLREYGMRRALLGTAFLFALLHVFEPLLGLLLTGSREAVGSVLVTGTTIFSIGLILGGLYARTRSLPLVFGVHAGFNGITVLLVIVDGLS